MDPLLVSGFKLMGLGMGAVFTFLSVLVFCMFLMSFVFNLSSKKMASPDDAGLTPGKRVQDDELIAVIGAAIQRFRNR